MHTCGVNLLFSKQKVLLVLLIVGGTDFGMAAELNVFPTEINSLSTIVEDFTFCSRFLTPFPWYP